MSKQLFRRWLAACLLYCAAAVPLHSAPGQDDLIAQIQSSATAQEKWTAAHQLAGIATPDAVPKLAALLCDENLSDIARFVLAAMPGPSVDKVLRAALPSTQAGQLAGIITTLGVRRDAKAVRPLTQYLTAPNPDDFRRHDHSVGENWHCPVCQSPERRALQSAGKNSPAILGCLGGMR